MDFKGKATKIVDGIQTIELDSWLEFFQLTVDKFSKSPAYIFRGQADYEWPVESTLDRWQRKFRRRKNLSGTTPEFFECPPFNEEEQLAAFRRAIRGRRGPNPPELSDDSCWALGQHHGLATPLTDWTRSPFVALFFAFEEHERLDKDNKMSTPSDRAVFALSTSVIDSGDRLLRLVSPPDDDNYRLVSQSALLLLQPRNECLEDVLRKRFRGENVRSILMKVIIPNDGRNECLVALSKMNINRMTLFPDIDGAAKYINSLWQPGHEESIAYV